MNYYYNPVRTVEGGGSIGEIPQLLTEIAPKGCHVLLLAWSESVFELEAFRSLINGDTFTVHPKCFTASNPTVEQLFEVYKETEAFTPEVVIAVGGGSVMDVGKSLCCLYGKEIASVDELRIMIADKNYGEITAKWIGVPTTAGTGSEVTCWATIWDPTKDAKRSVESKENYAYVAVVDSQLAMGMPVKLAVSSGLDAVAHAVESYWAKASNVASKAFALSAIRTIMESIDRLIDGDESAHEAMAQGSMLAGMAFSNTKTTACHSISYPLTMHYQIPHGTAVSMLLAPVLMINRQKTENEELLLQALGVIRAEDLEERIHTILTRAGIPATLKEWNVDYDKLPELAALGITKGRADNNPVDLNTDMIEEILKSIY